MVIINLYQLHQPASTTTQPALVAVFDPVSRAVWGPYVEHFESDTLPNKGAVMAVDLSQGHFPSGLYWVSVMGVDGAVGLTKGLAIIKD